MKKIISMLLALAAAAAVFTGCSENAGNGTSGSSAEAAGFDTANEITVISRENGSGTRGAFIELFGVEEKDADGNKVDKTTKGAEIASKTDVVLTSVASNPYAIGYVSLGSLNNTVKALKIDGVEATTENVKNGSYGVAVRSILPPRANRPALSKISSTLSSPKRDRKLSPDPISLLMRVQRALQARCRAAKLPSAVPPRLHRLWKS